MAQDRNLPEGTDKVITGASTGGAPRTPVTSTNSAIGGSSTTGTTTTTGSTTGSTTNGGSPRLADRVRSGGEKLSGQAADKARDLVGQGLGRSGDALANVSRLVSDTAEGLDERLGVEYGNYARRAADAIESTAQSLRTKNPDELIEDTRSFVRKSPGIALAGAAIVGFALARLVKTGLDSTSRDNDRSRHSDDRSDSDS